jgi:hypothetical protein
MKTNERKLVKKALQGQVMPPKCYGWEVTQTGVPAFLPAVGGITYNVKVGDPAFGWVADHVEPGVAFTASRDNLKGNPNKAFNAYSCVGNEARLISGAAKGRKGVVTGHHGGVEHVLIDFPDEVIRKMTEDDKVLITGYGAGLVLEDASAISCFGLSPALVRKMKVKMLGEGRVEVPVAAVVPPEMMGSGIGSTDNFKGDYDIQTQDEDALKKHKLDKLRIGDFVALRDQDNRYGIGYRKGAMTIGIVVHANSFLTGHGPGVQVLMTAPGDVIVPRLARKANIADYLKIGRGRKSS